MKQTLIIITCCLFFGASGQEKPGEFDGKKWQPPYFLDTLKGGDIERFLLPVSFAPSIPYKGVEDIRFAPGWSKKDTKEYWSYAFLWYLDSTRVFDSDIIEKNLVAYYTGLAHVNVDRNKVAVDKLVTVTASIKKKKSESPARESFEGTVDMLDYMTLKPLRLYLLIHISYCKEQDKTIVFHEISPQPFNDDIWKSLNLLWLNFGCTRD